MKVVYIKKEGRKFYKYLNENWKDGQVRLNSDYPNRIWLFKKPSCCMITMGRAKVYPEDREIGIELKERFIDKKSYDFGNFKNLLKTYEQKNKVKIILEIV